MAPKISRRPTRDHAAVARTGRTRSARSTGRRLLAGAALALAVLGTAATTACSSATVPSDPTLAKGQQVYNMNCVACHGSGGGGGTGPRLVGIADRMTEEQEIDKITNGVAGTAMPAWSGRLSAEDIDAVAAYTRSLTPPS